MKIIISHNSVLVILLAMIVSACRNDMLDGDADQETDNIINVGAEAAGLSISSSITPIEPNGSSRAAGATKPAEEVPWLVQPLKQGLDITYGRVPSYTGQTTEEKVAILKLSGESGDDITLKGETGNQYATNTNSGLAIYTFTYRDGGAKAKWYDNGPHYFEGVHVPNRIRYTSSATEIESDRANFNGVTNVGKVTNLTTDQSDNVESGEDNDLSNYYLLAHYLGMPANTRLSATVSRILLPFRHRLAHVLAYIIIDPALGTKINGYSNINTAPETFRDDPKTSDIRFCNVDVLKGVHDVKATDGLHTLTPEWAERVRKVIPHFYEQAGELIVYESAKKKIYPKSDGYANVNNTYTTAYNNAKTEGKSEEEAGKAGEKACGYTRKVYHDIPVYDLIVRPTYTSYDNVMYDEAGYDTESTRRTIANKKNMIDFQVGLENGLNYEKEFIFDLDANYETVVYLHISREGVDYNASGSELWQEESHNDSYYGVDNQNGHTLSQAGSSWQRAYYNTHLGDGDGDKITDGGFYDEGTAGEDGTKGQYISNPTWIENLREAYVGGKHHGDYFVLANDISIDASLLPTDGLVFTGHLDGFNTHGSTRGYHKIELTGGGSKVPYTDDMHEVLSKLYVNADCTDTVPELYYEAQIAQSKGSRGIEKGDPIKLDKSKTYPADLAGMVVYTLENGTYTKYDNRTFYKKCPNYLFAGLDGIYETNQERGQTPWEANVHKEGNYWLPYRDVSDSDESKHTGWRAEIMNLEIVGGTLFKDGAKITGNVDNCKDTNGKVDDHIPAMPKYK